MKKHFRIIIFFAFILCFLLGVWGWKTSTIGCGSNVPNCTKVSLSDAIYRTLQLLVIDGDGHAQNLQLEIARFTLPLFTLTSIIGIILKAFGRQLDFLKLRIRPAETVVFGSKRSALIMAGSIDSKKTVFFDLSDDGINHTGDFLESGVEIIPLETLDNKQLKSLNISSAKEIYLFTENDESNLQLAQTLIGFLNTSFPSLIINVDNQSILRAACREPAFKNYSKRGGEIIWFNQHRQASRALLREHPPLSISSCQHEGNVHIAVIGMDDFSQQLILNLIKNCVYLGSPQLAISVFSNNQDQFNDFISQHPSLTTNADAIGFGGFAIENSIKHYTTGDSNFLPETIKLAIDNDGAFLNAYVTGETDYSLIERAQRFKQGLLVLAQEISIVACLPNTHFNDTENVERLRKDKTEDDSFDGIRFFSTLGKSVNAKQRQLADKLGIIVQAAYDTIYHKELNEKLNSNPQNKFEPLFNDYFTECYEKAKQRWRTSLEEDFRLSSRCAADHFYVKFRELGYELIEKINETTEEVRPEMLAKLSKDIDTNLDKLSRLEHQRFCHERFIDGWMHAKISNKPTQLNKTLIPFDQLPPGEPIKDTAIIYAMAWIFQHPEIKTSFGLKENNTAPNLSKNTEKNEPTIHQPLQ